MKRRLLNLLTAVSLLLGVGTVALWGLSVWRRDVLSRHTSGHSWLMSNQPAGLYLAVSTTDDPQPPEPWQWATAPANGPSNDTLARFPSVAGIRAGQFHSGGARGRTYKGSMGRSVVSATTRFVRVPHWFLLTACLPLPVVAVWLRRRRRLRTSAGLCWRCGYDLRATPGRCPECGTAATVSTTA